MLTRDQSYALQAYEQVQKIKTLYETEKDTKGLRRYGAMSHKLPILIHTAGLAQALAFVESRVDRKQADRGRDPYRLFLNHLGVTIGVSDLLGQSRKVEFMAYIRLTQQVMDALVWYKRYAQSILDVDASMSAEVEAEEEDKPHAQQ